MVVDDEPDIVTTVTAVLEANGYNVVSAVSGDDCLKKIKSGENPNNTLRNKRYLFAASLSGYCHTLPGRSRHFSCDCWQS